MLRSLCVWKNYDNPVSSCLTNVEESCLTNALKNELSASDCLLNSKPYTGKLPSYINGETTPYCMQCDVSPNIECMGKCFIENKNRADNKPGKPTCKLIDFLNVSSNKSCIPCYGSPSCKADTSEFPASSIYVCDIKKTYSYTDAVGTTTWNTIGYGTVCSGDKVLSCTNSGGQCQCSCVGVDIAAVCSGCQKPVIAQSCEQFSADGSTCIKKASKTMCITPTYSETNLATGEVSQGCCGRVACELQADGKYKQVCYRSPASEAIFTEGCGTNTCQEPICVNDDTEYDVNYDYNELVCQDKPSVVTCDVVTSHKYCDSTNEWSCKVSTSSTTVPSGMSCPCGAPACYEIYEGEDVAGNSSKNYFKVWVCVPKKANGTPGIDSQTYPGEDLILFKNTVITSDFGSQDYTVSSPSIFRYSWTKGALGTEVDYSKGELNKTLQKYVDYAKCKKFSCNTSTNKWEWSYDTSTKTNTACAGSKCRTFECVPKDAYYTFTDSSWSVKGSCKTCNWCGCGLCGCKEYYYTTHYYSVDYGYYPTITYYPGNPSATKTVTLAPPVDWTKNCAYDVNEPGTSAIAHCAKGIEIKNLPDYVYTCAPQPKPADIDPCGKFTGTCTNNSWDVTRIYAADYYENCGGFTANQGGRLAYKYSYTYCTFYLFGKCWATGTAYAYNYKSLSYATTPICDPTSKQYRRYLNKDPRDFIPISSCVNTVDFLTTYSYWNSWTN
jgi:hypothetical protein